MDIQNRNLISQLKHWYDSPLGQQMLDQERELIDRALSEVQGNRLLQVSLDGRRWFCEHARAKHGVLLAPQVELGMESNTLVARPEDLPVQSAVIDILVMHHAFEFSADPHQVLREAARVLRPGGTLILLAFNPVSLMGMHSLLRGREQAPFSARMLGSGRLADWFRLLQLSPLKTRSRGYDYPLENPRWRRRLRWLGALLRMLPGQNGNLILLTARKDVAGMTPLRPEWNRRLLGGLQVIESKAGTSGIRRNQT